MKNPAFHVALQKSIKPLYTPFRKQLGIKWPI